MARSQRHSKLETRTARLKLKVGQRYFMKIGEGLALGYRRASDGYGNWQARLMMTDGRYDFQALGRADDFLEANGADVLSFFQAQGKARDVAKRLAKGSKVEREITIEAATARYLDWYAQNRKALKETTATIEAHIMPIFGTRMLSSLTTAEIKAWHQKLATKPGRVRTGIGKRQQYRDKPETQDQKRARKSTANRILTVLKAILNKAFEDELAADDTPWRRVRPFENADEPLTRFLTEAECRRLINASRADFRQLVKAALFTGARYSELTGLTVANVNPDTRSVYIQPSKSGRGRHIPLSAGGLDFFRTAIAGNSGTASVFTKVDGTPWGKNHHIRPLMDACNKATISPAITFHELRHTYASLLAQAGADLLTISKLLGHADTRITSRHYAHLCDRTLANAVNTLLPSFGHEPDGKVANIH